VAFHGPTVNTLADTESDSCLSLMQAISLRNPIILFASHGNVVVPGVAVGPLLVGNLTTLCHLVGTPFMPNLCGHILLIEDRGEALYRIDRMLNHMKMAGCFEQLKGLALGHFTECGDVVDIEALAAELFQDYRIPILSGFDVGHHRRNFTLPLGLTVKLDTWNQTLSLQSAATC
jgi:muramoyltetrapeptide carboxypeptidase